MLLWNPYLKVRGQHRRSKVEFDIAIIVKFYKMKVNWSPLLAQRFLLWWWLFCFVLFCSLPFPNWNLVGPCNYRANTKYTGQALFFKICNDHQLPKGWVQVLQHGTQSPLKIWPEISSQDAFSVTHIVSSLATTIHWTWKMPCSLMPFCSWLSYCFCQDTIPSCDG